jgi:predicted secreted acid phosphatase
MAAPFAGILPADELGLHAALAAARKIKTARHLKRHAWVVIMDADETVLDNSLNEVQRDMCPEATFNPKRWESWVRAGATAEADPGMADVVPGAAAFTQAIHSMGGLVAIVTNRDVADDSITQNNLKRLGIWFDYEIGQDASKPDEKASKLTRWQAAVAALSTRFHIRAKAVMWVGDQVTDLALTDANGNMIGAMSNGVGSNRFLVPNPMYGNWMH